MSVVLGMGVMLGLLAPGLSSALPSGATARPRLVSSPPGQVGVPWTGVLAASSHPVVVARLGTGRQRVRATRMRPSVYRLRAVFATPGRWTLNVGRFRVGAFVVRPRALRLVHAVDVVIEPSGALLVVDVASNRVFRQSIGRLSVVAGNGRSGRSGDGGPAARAATGFPIEVALHPRGGFGLVHDERYIRHVDVSGTISTTVELDQPTALAYDAAGNLFVSELGGRVQRIGTDGARATYAGFNQPHGLAVAPDGSVYVCDTFNNVCSGSSRTARSRPSRQVSASRTI